MDWNLSHRCRTEDALDHLEQAVLNRLLAGSREVTLTLTTDNGTTYHHSESNSYIERFRRSLKEEEIWRAEWGVT